MRYAFPELREMDIAAHVFDEEIRTMNMDPSQRPLSMAIEGVGDLVNKIWEAIKKILTAIPNLCKKLIEKIKDSKLVASKNVNKAEDLPASAKNLSSDKLAKYKSYRAEIDSRRKKLMHLTRDVVQTAIKNCDQFNEVAVPILNACDESNFFNLKENAKYAADGAKLDGLYKDMQTNGQALSKIKSQAESLQNYLTQFKNEIGNEKMFGEWVPNYSGDDDYESLINDLSTKSKKYLEDVEKQRKRFETIRRKLADKVTGNNSKQNDGYKILQQYQENNKQCNDILQAYTAVATVVYGVYTQGVKGDAEDAKGISGSTGWVWNDKDKKNAHWDYVARVRLKSGKQIMLTYAYNNEKDGSKQPSRDIEKVKKDIIDDYNKTRANGDPAEEVIGQGVTGQAASAIKNDVNQTKQDIKNVVDKVVGFKEYVSNMISESNAEAAKKKLDDKGKELFDRIMKEKTSQGLKYKGFKDGVMVFVDEKHEKVADNSFKDLNGLVNEAKNLGYSDEQIKNLKSDYNNKRIQDINAWNNWKSAHNPENSSQNNQQNKSQDNQQTQQNNSQNNQQLQSNNSQNNQQNGNNKTAYNTIADTLSRGNISVDQAQKLIKMIPKQTEASDTKAQKLIQDAINENRKNNKANNDDKNVRANLAQQINSGKVEGANSKIKINSSYLKILVDNLSNSTISVDQAQKILSNVSYMDDVNDFQNKVKEAADENKKHHYSDNDDKKNKAKYIEELKNQYGRAAGGLLFAKREKERAFGKGYATSKDAAYLTDEIYERALEYVYDYGMPFEDAVEAVLEEVEAEENSYIDAAVESLFADEFDDIDHSKAYYQEDDEDRWDNFLT